MPLLDRSYQRAASLATDSESHSVVSNSVTPWTAARQAPLSMGFFRQDYWSGLPCPTPGDLSNPGIEPASPLYPPLAGGLFTTEPPAKLSEVPLLSKSPQTLRYSLFLMVLSKNYLLVLLLTAG